jgi:hypothetical protein
MVQRSLFPEGVQKSGQAMEQNQAGKQDPLGRVSIPGNEPGGEAANHAGMNQPEPKAEYGHRGLDIPRES